MGCRCLCALKKAIQTKNAPRHLCPGAVLGAPEETRTPDLLIRSQTGHLHLNTLPYKI